MPSMKSHHHRTGQESPAGLAHIRIKPSLPDYPRSYTANYTQPAAITPEEDLIKNLKVYRCPQTDSKRASELTSLHLLDVNAKKLCFDGYFQDETSDIWLRLQQPASRYKRFHAPFIWVAVLGKRTLDYIDEQPRSTVSLESFESDFHRWLEKRFGMNESFKEWYTMSGNACNLSTARLLTSHPVWAHCKVDRMTAISRQPSQVNETLTTSLVFESFQLMYFASKLKQIVLVAGVSRMQRKRKEKLGFAEDSTTIISSSRSDRSTKGESNVCVGDVVSILPDETDRTKWQKSEAEWLAYYCSSNELFLSENCNCGQREILSSDVKRKHGVAWSPRSLNTVKDYFVRQTYIPQDSTFVSVNDDHKTCSCRKSKLSTVQWRAGDTVYITKIINGQNILEPVVIHEIDYRIKEAKVRVLLRLGRDYSGLALQASRRNFAPNELVLTGELKALPISRIQQACHVIFVQGSSRLVYLEGLPKGFHEAREKPLPCRKLRGLSLFGGGGGLDRGLEEGGAVEFQTSVDYDSAAIHTQRANCQDPQTMRLFCGSVDDYVKAVLSEAKNRPVAHVGEVDVIAAGSPCPGFSALQPNMLSEQSLTYASHITTFCTAVDLYRPLYGALEDQNVLSQLVACLVSMGYQVNQYIMDSWTYRSCQQRSRIILTIAVPGLEPILQLLHTHSRSSEDTTARSLGKLPNGERFGDREHYATPFQHVTAEEVTSDLPDIGSGNVQTCIPFPDHRLSRPTNRKARALIECIPTNSPGSGCAGALRLDLVPASLQLRKKETTKSFQRIKANGLVPTITTDVNKQDARNGASVHWLQHRPLSVQEAKRTQGYKDHEPIIGTLREQWKILSNGVDRKVSFAVGIALREERDANPSDASEHSRSNVEQEASSASSDSSASMDSTRETRQQFDMSLSLDGAYNPLPIRPQPLPPQEPLKVEAQPTLPGGFLSRLSCTFSTNVGRLSLPSIPTFGPSTLPSLPKRQREDFKSEVQDVDENSEGPLKRKKIEEVRRTTSPARVEPGIKNQLEDRRASMPPLPGSNRTRRSGRAEIAPKAWHKKIGSLAM
ncbi:S-adenosyl-L-methionine-dependent methyltransferase [Didymella exigua CBS 183.55]|uniref:DNA (cytosine-5-)-methyltransferase n=1 Tax=Didymella exigua CBS 183.55 TaxID=1150837 RepID=A0A6A5RTE2_9PLEO|nr:S-adenosyl-L-methionine-dependent methyltransferase [Didymella exigua CBS 183.55]KAF1931755.1 S-adenosyl-L-methionine-dependent methyltransferase [Didymella exigua CBS 183.55]